MKPDEPELNIFAWASDQWPGCKFAKDSEITSMHPSFGMEYKCPSLEWKELMKGPSQNAVFAHLRKVLQYRSLFNAGGSLAAASSSPVNRP